MRKGALWIAVLLFFLTVSVLGKPPEVLPPNETGYSALELAELRPALDQLGGVLSDAHLGCQRAFRPPNWNSLAFSAYTAGVLAGLGYQSRLVTAEGWPEGTHTWVLVGILLPGRTAWIPVEASPAPGKTQSTLGTIPIYTDGEGRLWFEPTYLHFSNEIYLPANASPVAVIRTDRTYAIVGQGVTFMALASYDPDGEIVRYRWDLGDGESAQGRIAIHFFKEARDYTVTLTVTDSRGASNTTSITLAVAMPRATPSGCGCGK